MMLLLLPTPWRSQGLYNEIPDTIMKWCRDHEFQGAIPGRKTCPILRNVTYILCCSNSILAIKNSVLMEGVQEDI